MDNLKPIAQILMVVGAINWGLVGVADMNIVTELFGVGTQLTQIV